MSPLDPVIRVHGEDQLSAALRGNVGLPTALTLGGTNPTQAPVQSQQRQPSGLPASPTPNNPLPPVPGFVNGGPVNNIPQDNVLATLQTGETVVNTPASNMFPRELEQMNNLGRSLMGVPGFAGGGRVPVPYNLGGRVVGPPDPLAVALAQGAGVPGRPLGGPIDPSVADLMAQAQGQTTGADGFAKTQPGALDPNASRIAPPPPPPPPAQDYNFSQTPVDPALSQTPAPVSMPEGDIGGQTPAGFENFGTTSYDPNTSQTNVNTDFDQLAQVTGDPAEVLKQQMQEKEIARGKNPVDVIDTLTQEKLDQAATGQLGTSPAANEQRLEASTIGAAPSTFAQPAATPGTGQPAPQLGTGPAGEFGAEARTGLQGALESAQNVDPVTGAQIGFDVTQPAAVEAQRNALTFQPEQVAGQEAQAAQLGFQPTDVVGQFGAVDFDPIRQNAMRSGQELLGGLMAGRGGLGQTRSSATERMMGKAAGDIASKMGAQEAQFQAAEQERLRQAALAQSGQGLQAATTQAGLTQQANMMNPQMAQQAALANQAAGLQGSQLGLQQAQGNQQAGLQAALANQQAGLQTQGLEAGLAQSQAGLNQQANLANQQAGLQAAGLQGSLAGQIGNLGLGLGGLDLQAQTQQEQLRQSLLGQETQAGQFQQQLEQQAGQFGQEQELQRFLAEEQSRQAALGGIGAGAAGFFGSDTGGKLAEGLLSMIPGVGGFFA